MKTSHAFLALASLTLLYLPSTQGQLIIEAEDFNFDGGQYIGEPTAGAYADKGTQGLAGVDFLENTPGTRAADEYRSFQGLPQTSASADATRAAGVPEVDLVSVETGEWVNYTRTFPAGDYLVSAQIQQVANGEEPFIARLEKVTTDSSAPNQSTSAVGVFLGRNATTTHGPLAMTDVGGNTTVTVRLDGEETLRFAAQSGALNLNFLQFTPANQASPMPRVDISQPTDGLGVQPGSSLEIVLTVPDIAAVAGVQLVANSLDGEEIPLGELVSAPFNFTWNDVPSGSFRLLGIVVSSNGQIGLSSEISIFSDGTPPTILDARGRTIEDVVITFSEALALDTAGNPDNYSIKTETGEPLAVASASVSSDGRVILSTAEQAVGTPYTINLNNLTDRAGNALAADTSVSFVGNGPLLQTDLGFVVFEAEHFDRNLDGLWFEDTDRGSPSGGVSMVIPNGGGGSEAATKLEYDIKFVKTGQHYIWYRASSESGTDDSSWLHFDGDRPAERADGNRASMTGFGSTPDFVWLSRAQDGGDVMSFTVGSPGVHTISIARREDGAFFDKLVIGTDPNFDPAAIGDFGPALTPREGEAVESTNEVAITQNPMDVVGDEHSTISLEAGGELIRGEIVLFQWQRKQGEAWNDIPDATLPTFTLERVTRDWHGAVVRFSVSTDGDSKMSSEATITVLPETTRPQLIGISGLQDRINLQFSEPIDSASANDMANYTVSNAAGPLAITNIDVLSSEQAIIITTAAQKVGTKYTVSLSGLQDQAAQPNSIASTEAKFYSLGELLPQSADGLLVFEAENVTENLGDLWTQDTARGTPSRGVSMVLPNSAGGNEDTKLEYELTFTQTGEHIIWYRASAANGSDDSAWLHVDGARPDTRLDGNQASMTGFGDQDDFIWLSNPQEGGGQMTFNIDQAGVHRIGVARREDGAFFDKFVITTDPEFNPSDLGPFGPAETREGTPPLPDLSITAPGTIADGADLIITPSISASERTTAKVEYFADGEKIGEATSSPFTFTWVNPPAGFYSITAHLLDDVGDRVAAERIEVAVDGDPNAGGGGDVPIVNGTDISVIWISQLDSAAGSGFKELLGLSDFEVTELFINDPTTAEQATLNAADVVVISRKTSSGDYNNSTWDEAITAPLLLMTPYLSRANRWQWFGDNNLIDATPESILSQAPDHPLFTGVVLTDAVSDAWHTMVDRGTTIATDPIANGGTVLASADGNMIVAEWPANTVAAGPRMLFSAGSRESDGAAIDTAGKFDLTPTGARAFLNAILYLGQLDETAQAADLGITVDRSATGIRVSLVGAAAFDVEYSPSLETGSWTVIASDVTASFEDTEPARVSTSTGYYRGVAK